MENIPYIGTVRRKISKLYRKTLKSENQEGV